MKKLHLGCYRRKIAGFINVDIREDVNPDVVDDAFTLKTFQSNSIDVIYVCHMLEHTPRNKIKEVLQRWYDVLKPNGTLRIAVPDLEAVFEYYMFSKDLDILTNFLYGSQKHPFDFHYMGWNEKTLTRDLVNNGFQNVHRYDWKDTEHFFVDDYSQAYLPEIAYCTRDKRTPIKGKLLSLNMEATAYKNL